MKGSIGRQRLRTWLPFLSWRSRVTPASLRADFSAGLTGSLILVPQGVAFATIAGMPPEYGLYAAMVPVVIAALFGSSWHMVSGPTTAISIVVFASLSPLAEPGSAAYVQLALTLSFLSGCIMLALGWLRLGSLMNFVSHTVVVGFTAGAAVLIATSQLKNFFGLPIPRGATFAQAMQGVFTQWDAINPWVMLVAISTLLSSVLVRRYLPRMPHMIAGLAVGSAVAAALNAALGPGRTGIETLAALPRGLPPLSLPDVSAESFRQLLPIAVALSMLSLTEALSIARALALKTGQRIDSNQEFLGQGLSNVLGSLFSAYPSSGSFNRSGLNLEAGACTPLAAVISAVLLVAILQFVAPWAVYLPLPAMAGVLMLVAWGLFDVRQATHILTHSRQESAVLVATFLATLFLQLEFPLTTLVPP
ncbi:MAG: SulP family inorganic anion transporter [Rubrivivax sp.]